MFASINSNSFDDVSSHDGLLITLIVISSFRVFVALNLTLTSSYHGFFMASSNNNGVIFNMITSLLTLAVLSRASFRDGMSFNKLIQFTTLQLS